MLRQEEIEKWSPDNLHTSIEGYTRNVTVGHKSPWLQPLIGPMTTKWQIVSIDHMLPTYGSAWMQWNTQNTSELCNSWISLPNISASSPSARQLIEYAAFETRMVSYYFTSGRSMPAVRRVWISQCLKSRGKTKNLAQYKFNFKLSMQHLIIQYAINEFIYLFLFFSNDFGHWYFHLSVIWKKANTYHLQCDYYDVLCDPKFYLKPNCILCQVLLYFFFLYLAAGSSTVGIS